jgi:translocation and assembly module TamB
LGVFLVLLVLGIIFLFRSQSFQNYLSRVAQEKATAAVGTPVEFGHLSLGWRRIGPTVEIDRIVVHGAPPFANVPVLQAQSLGLRITITSLLHRSWYIDDLQIDHPVIRVVTDAQGNTNLPAKKTSAGSNDRSGITTLFELGIRHFAVNQGEAHYNDMRTEFGGDVEDLNVLAGFESSSNTYSGTLGYKNGIVRAKGIAPVTHALEVRFNATPEVFTLPKLELTAKGSQVSISGTVKNYAQPEINAAYQARLDSRDVREIMKNPAVPVGVVNARGNLEYRADPNRPFLSAVKASGELNSTNIVVPLQKSSVPIRDFSARYALNNGNVAVEKIRASLLGGALNADLQMRDLTGKPQSHLTARLINISTADVQHTLSVGAALPAIVKGALNANADATWGATFDDLLAKAHITTRAMLQSTHGQPIPLEALIDATYRGQNGSLALAPSTIQLPAATVLLNGTVSQNSSLQVRANVSDLHQLELLAASFQPSSQTLNLSGRATLTSTVSGSVQNPQIRGQLTANDIRLRGTSWNLLQTQFMASPSNVRLDQGQLVPTSGGRLSFQGSAALHEWKPLDDSRFQFHLTAADLNIGELARASGSTTPFAGKLSADLSANGTRNAPGVAGHIQLANARVAEEPIRSANLALQTIGDTVRANLKLQLTAGNATTDLQYQPKQKAYQINLNATGIKLEQLETVKARNMQIAGVLNITASGSGTLDDPGLQARVEIPHLQMRDQAADNIRLDAAVANHVAKVNFNSQMLGTQATGQGTIQLVGDYQTEASLNTGVIALQPLVAIYAPAQAANVSGQTQLDVTLRGPLKQKNNLQGHLVVSKFNVKYGNAIELAATAPIRADYVNGTLDVQRGVIKGTETELTFQAHVPADKNSPASLLLRGGVDLRLLSVLQPDVSSSGQIQFDVNSFGARSNPNVHGQIRIVNASLAQVGTPLGLRDGNGVLTLTSTRLDINQFTAKMGGGDVSARGGLVYRPDLHFDLAAKAVGVRVLYEQSIRTTLGADLALTGRSDDALLQGQVNVDQLSFTSNFELADFASQFGGSAAPPPTPGLSDRVRLQVAIKTPGGISPSSRALSLSGSANLQLQGTVAQPVMLGRINLSNGELIFAKNRYLVQGGTIDFRNPSKTEPVVDISANTTIQQYDIQLHFWGPLDHLHTNYSSNPALPPSDVINLVAFGKTSEASAANPTPPGALGAQSLIASQLSSQVTSRVEKLAGISQLSIDPELGSSQQSPGARIAIQQRVTSKVFVTFATDVTSTQQQAVKVEYQVSPRASFSAVRNQNGGFSFETQFRKRW